MPKPSDWMSFAEGDLNAAKILFKEECSVASVFYHCQQSAEKALKAYISFRGHPIIKTHDLVKLINICLQLDAEFMEWKNYAYELNPFASSTRYPDDYFLIPNWDVARDCIKKAEQIFDFVKYKVR